MRKGPPDEDGFTLIDTLIAVVIMGTTVVALVTAMSGVIVTTQFHRGNAVAEDVTHNAVEAIVARMNVRTTLTADVSATTSPLPVQNAAGFVGLAWVNVDDEMMKLTAVNLAAKTLSVQRAPGDPASASNHSAGAAVVPAFRCPAATELSPVSAGWAPAGVIASITTVEYWAPASASFVDLTLCGSQYDARCLQADGSPGDRRFACDTGLERITLTVTTSGDSRYKGVTATTQALVRRGSG